MIEVIKGQRKRMLNGNVHNLRVVRCLAAAGSGPVIAEGLNIGTDAK